MLSSRNKTIRLTPEEIDHYCQYNKQLTKQANLSEVENSILCQDLFSAIPLLPAQFVDLLIIDPPYNLDKNFGAVSFKQQSVQEYSQYLDSFLSQIVRLLKPDATVYICGDWRSSISIYEVASKYFAVRNRITWQREKGRGSKTNWKNAHEDIWFCTQGKSYTFQSDKIKIRRKVLAPYKQQGKAKDWFTEGKEKFRDTFASNFWDNITIPYWSMAENTNHPTQKPEKLLAKLILASSKEGQIVLDPFVGSGSTCVVAKKLNRRYVGIEIDQEYAALTQKRLAIASKDKQIQGYDGQVFWERNSRNVSKKKK